MHEPCTAQGFAGHNVFVNDECYQPGAADKTRPGDTRVGWLGSAG